VAAFEKIVPPKDGTRMVVRGGTLLVPENPIVCYLDGDGVGPEVLREARAVVDRAVWKAYDGARKIVWLEVYAGSQAMDLYGEPLPGETLEAIRQYRVALKGPLATEVGAGYRSLNVAIRQILALYACVRPVRYIPGVPCPVVHPERVNMVVFRENTEDVYAGIEWEQGTDEALKVIDFLYREMGFRIPADSGVGIKPMSRQATRKLMRSALDYALANHRRSVTLVTKGNIMKFTEGAFRKWAHEVAREEYGDKIVEEGKGDAAQGKIVLKDRLADNMFQQVLLYPEQYDVIATPNLNGDYLSDALAAQVGGLGLAPGANLGDSMGVFEATHGTAPDIAGKGIVNPTASILSGALMLEYMGWPEAARVVHSALAAVIASRRVTGDLSGRVEGATDLSTRRFGEAVIQEI